MLFQNRYRIASTRLEGWDYSATGYYFVTICTHGRECCLGEVVAGEMHLSGAGMIVMEEWQNTARIRENITLDEWVVMPNHLHGIIVITGAPHRETPHRGVSTGGWRSGSLGAIIGQFKSVCTKRIRADGFDFAWQTRYFDRVIRSEPALQEVREYIRKNPLRWELDLNNPKNL